MAMSVKEGFPGVSDGKESSYSERDLGSIGGLGRPLEEGMATHSLLLPGESQEQRNQAGYSPWGHKALNTTDSRLIC